MSRENVELVRRAFDAFNTRDWEAFAGLMDEKVEAESRLAAIEGGYNGHDGLRRWWDDLLAMLPDYTLHIREIRDCGEVMITRFEARAHGASSAIPLRDPAWHATRWRNGRCVWWRVCVTEEEALEAVGLRE